VGTTVKEVFSEIKKLTNYKKSPELKILRDGELVKTYLDFSKAEKELGWKPKVSFKEGIKNLVEFAENGSV
jgi:UDP-glucose 4-epimerase